VVENSSPLAGLTDAASRRRSAEVLRAAERAPDATAVLKAASAALALYVPSSAGAWSVVDPGTLLPSWPMHIANAPYQDSTAYWEREFLVDGSMLFRDLAGRTVPVGRLFHETSGLMARSARYREFMAPRGYTDDLRAVLRVAGTSWGFIELLRGPGEKPFTAEEAAFVAALVEPLARILRTKIIQSTSQLRAASDTPGLLVFDSAGVLTSLNESAGAWLQELPNGIGEPDHLPDAISAVLGFARAVAAGGQRGPARLRVRARSGHWIVLDASCLSGADGIVSSTAVVIERAVPAEVAPIIVSAYDLSAREQEITRLLTQGTTTAGIAATLHLSVYTVRDYIKDIFAKVAVSSRGELVARLFHEHYQRPLVEAAMQSARQD
jgi:DNA-binding CsgD family transcriptional regulator